MLRPCATGKPALPAAARPNPYPGAKSSTSGVRRPKKEEEEEEEEGLRGGTCGRPAEELEPEEPGRWPYAGE